jgi:hypothetical protein
MACSGNSATVNENICTNATGCADPAQLRYWHYEATVTGPPATQGPWRQVGIDCLERALTEPALTPVLAVVTAEYLTRRLTAPAVQVSPPIGLVVQLPNGFSAGTADPIQLAPDLVLGRTLTITATPIRWTWDFGDGTRTTTAAPGRPGANTGPTSVTHTYATPGDKTVTVTVSYAGTFTLAGITGTFPITGTAQATSAPSVITLHEAHAQLIAG